MPETVRYVSFNIAASAICAVFMVASVASIIGTFVYLKQPSAFRTVNLRIVKLAVLVLGILMAVVSLISIMGLSLAIHYISRVKTHIDATRDTIFAFEQSISKTSRALHQLVEIVDPAKINTVEPLMTKWDEAVAGSQKPIDAGYDVVEKAASNQISGMVLSICTCIYASFSLILCAAIAALMKFGPKFLHMPIWITAIVLMLIWWWIAIFLMPVVVDVFRACCDTVRTATGYVHSSKMHKDEVLYFLSCKPNIKPNIFNTIDSTFNAVKEKNFKTLVKGPDQTSKSEIFDPNFKTVSEAKFIDNIDCKWSSKTFKEATRAVCGGTLSGLLITGICAFLFGILSAVFVILNLIIQKLTAPDDDDDDDDDYTPPVKAVKGGKAPAVAPVAKGATEKAPKGGGAPEGAGAPEAGDAAPDETPKDVETKADEPSDGQTMFFHEDIPPGLTPKPWKKRVTFDFACSVSYQYG